MIAGVLAGGLKSVLGVVIVFLVLVTIHEFGHFIVAKKAGVLVPKFAIGFGPPIFRFGKGETEYSIRLLPLGGYVQLAGDMPQDQFFKLGETLAIKLNDSGEAVEIGDPADIEDGMTGTLAFIDTMKAYKLALEVADGYREFPIARRAFLITGKDRIALAPPDRQMAQKPLLARMLIILAGPLMNVLLAMVLFAVVLGSIGIVTSPPQVASVMPNSPAAKAGMVSGDIIERVNGQSVTSWPQLVLEIEQHAKDRLAFTVLRGAKEQTLYVVPRERKSGIGFIGISPAVTHGVGPAIIGGAQQTAVYTQLIYNSFGTLFTHRNAFVKDSAGPVKIVAIIGQQAQLGILNLMNLTALLSLNLAILNLLPIPPLDGSRLLFLLVEFVRGRPIDPRKEYIVHAIGFVLIIALTVVRTYLDVAQLF
ncbi:RIP metalloprotease RseP [Sulfoacidibacillus thermotolerans]|uniref:RIP metalloprotease RseP n=1 Tax=Sulfoacidibacillus thermotolerans TaxID=1765684 RepID=UPI000D6927FD|nr:RIP metalloprotease RseP [Sulfoacidibacillus thermotolerans]